ncbi:p-hydroxybenzoic acid efflux pump subunit AaeB [Entomobacter blattae]|uniref:p-hydroxybenzoic acid efflux pump subunit AaeB n=1 Tax=Entomobacter blattae TaxID=2762277 RepID=A0A7H1NQK4_9PROT|nr:p-hydroxybenzoic acid efflux pump subunit AaeB [Entomobacter blattae]
MTLSLKKAFYQAAPVGIYAVSLKNWLFPPGCWSFCLRTWLSVVLALSASFWLQLESPSSAAITVMLLAQPLRGQVLSKAIYRMAATIIGAIVSIILVALFPQERYLLLGGMGLWLCTCVAIGSLERDFRSYGAILAGYTAIIISIAAIDQPQDVFELAVNRTAAIAVGIATVACINDFFGSPTAWKKLAEKLHLISQEVYSLADRAIEGHPLPNDKTIAELAARIIGLISDMSFARTEMEDSVYRTAGARSAMVGMLDIISCSRAINDILHHQPITQQLHTKIRTYYTSEMPAALSVYQTQNALETLLEKDQKTGQLILPTSPQEAFLIERTERIVLQTRWVANGIDTLIRGRKAASASPPTRIVRHQDRFAAFMNALRTLFGFSITAFVCVLSGIPAITITLSQVSIMLTQAGLNPAPKAIGYGSLIGIPLTICSAAIVNYFALPYGNSMVYLAIILLPQVFLACLLLLNPKTSQIGFNFGVFFFAVLSLENRHDFDPTAFVDRSVYFLFASILIFICIVLIFPVSARRRRFRIALSVVTDLKNQFFHIGEHEGPALVTRQYDRLAQTLLWNDQRPQTLAAEKVFSRLMSLGDLNGALARSRRYLERACHIPAALPAAQEALSAITDHDRAITISSILFCCETFLQIRANLIREEQGVVLSCAAALYHVAHLLKHNTRALYHSDIIAVKAN